ncbi:zinc ribbon domain-containing protein [uncultured Anaerococcus sp.]|uniref:zinc ribbon domain-containing protein n=1 Tax=uncultured Anaerococcus sp. TaxID=293428 RepID=UPI002889D15D|nr:zinc ribbon domain-containing protein [uncultured Anaerococcus sp.]
MKCEHCGANIDKASNFCPVCGSKIEIKDQVDQSKEENKKTKKTFQDFFNFNKNKAHSTDHTNPNENQAKEGFEDSKQNDFDKVENPNFAGDDSSKAEEEGFFKPDRLDRMDKASRRYENIGEKSSPYNQRSVIEEVQAKVSFNNAKSKGDEDYYIDDYKSYILNKKLEEKLDKLIGDGESDLSNITVSAGIRKIQARNKKLSRENFAKANGDEILKHANPKAKTPAVREVDKKEEAKEKTEEKSQEKTKVRDFKKYLTSRNLLLALIGILIAIILGALYMKKSKADDITIPLSDYISISYEGEDGSAVPKASIDTEKLLKAYGDEIKYISRDNNKDSYETPAKEFVADLQNNVVFQYSKDNGLSNGDEITVMANLDNIKISDKYNVLISNSSKAVIIDGIANDNVTDPFTYINVKFEGKSPNMTLTASLKDDAPEFMHTVDIIPAKSNGIKEGEEVAVSLNFNADEMKNTYNVSLSPTNKNFTATAGDGEDSSDGDSEYIKSTSHLDQTMLGDLKYKAGDLIRKTILYKNIINVDNVEYLGSFTGFNADNSGDVKNKVYLIYEVTTSEKLPDSNFQSSFKYYTFVEYQNVKKARDADGKFYSQGPITTDNQIFHKFFVESDYKYYQIEYQGFGFIDKAIANVGAGLQGLTVTEDNKTNITDHFATSDGVVGEYEADGRRISLRSDGSLTYQIDKAVHLGSYSDNGGEISATIKGVNVDTPITLKFENGTLKAESQGEFNAASFSKIENF